MNPFAVGTLTVSAAVLTCLSCGSVHETELPPPALPDSTPSVEFRHVDSLGMAGEFSRAVDSLLCKLGSTEGFEEQLLYRLLGLYHGRAMEEEFVALLDSLELEGMGPFLGWKVSALDLAGRPAAALARLEVGDPFLAAWLSRDSIPFRTDLSALALSSPGEAYVLALLAPPGSLDHEELLILAEYHRLFPSVKGVILREIREAHDGDGDRMTELLLSLETDSSVDLLLAEAAAAAGSGSLSFWLDGLEGTDRLAALSAGVVLERFGDEYTPSWAVADRLAGLGETGLASRYSAAGDHWHRAGTEMAVLLAERSYDRLMEHAGSIGLDAPDSLRARAVLFRAHALKGAGRGGGVYHPAYMEFASLFPGHAMARETAYAAGRYYDCEQQWERAAEAYLLSLRCAGTYGGDERGHWRGGFCLYMSGRLQEADSLWAAACDIWSGGYWRDEMLFWRARLAGETGDTDLRDSLLLLVAAEHPWEFYGMLAGRRLGIDTGPSFESFEIDLKAEGVCSLALAMTAEGYGSAAVEMLFRGIEGPVEKRAAALSLLGRHGYSLSMLRELDVSMREESGEMLPDSLLFVYYPSPYRELALAATDTLVLDVDVLQGIMREESYFNRWVVSSAGARGVVQLMPATAYDVARWHGLPFLSDEDFFDPRVSVPYGALYMERQIGRFDGHYPLFLAAYNAGPGNASRWVNMHGWNPNDPEMYIEQITYRETRMYVKKVLRSAWIYERR